MTMKDAVNAPTPDLFFEAATAYVRTEALRTAVELDLFTAVAAGGHTAVELAQRCSASEKGMRVLCDYLVVVGFLRKDGARYMLTADTAMFLDRSSPAYDRRRAGVSAYADTAAGLRPPHGGGA